MFSSTPATTGILENALNRRLAKGRLLEQFARVGKAVSSPARLELLDGFGPDHFRDDDAADCLRLVPRPRPLGSRPPPDGLNEAFQLVCGRRSDGPRAAGRGGAPLRGGFDRPVGEQRASSPPQRDVAESKGSPHLDPMAPHAFGGGAGGPSRPDGPADPPPAPRRPPEPPPSVRPLPVRPQPVRPPTPGGGSERGRRPPGPPSVRQGTEPGPRDPLRPIELPSRAFEMEGEAWLVRESGRISAGVGRATRAALLHLVFALASAPERPLRELLTEGRALAELGEEELPVLLARARPYRERQERQEVFPNTRKKGGKGM